MPVGGRRGSESLQFGAAAAAVRGPGPLSSEPQQSAQLGRGSCEAKLRFYSTSTRLYPTTVKLDSTSVDHPLALLNSYQNLLKRSQTLLNPRIRLDSTSVDHP